MRRRLGWIVILSLALLWAVGLRVAIRSRGHALPFSARREESQETAELVASLPPIEPPSWTIRREDATRLDAKWVIALLRTKRTAELEAALDAAEDTFEANPAKEPWIEALFDGFDFAGARDFSALDEWVAASPRSFVGYVARATALIAGSEDTRGATRRPNDPSSRAGRDLSLARQDLARALELRPKCIVAHTALLRAQAPDGARPPRHLLDRALAVCPACFAPRAAYLLGLRPASGGTREEMAAFAEESQSFAMQNPRLRALRGYADWDDCVHLMAESHLTAATEACDRAIRAYPMPAFLRTKASLLYRQDSYAKSAGVLSDVLAMNAFDLRALIERARAYTQTEDWEKAALDLRLALELKPEDADAARLYGWLVERLEREARDALRGHDLDGAFSAYATAARAIPEKASFRSARDAVGKRVGLLPAAESAVP